MNSVHRGRKFLHWNSQLTGVIMKRLKWEARRGGQETPHIPYWAAGLKYATEISMNDCEGMLFLGATSKRWQAGRQETRWLPSLHSNAPSERSTGEQVSWRTVGLKRGLGKMIPRAAPTQSSLHRPCPDTAASHREHGPSPLRSLV